MGPKVSRTDNTMITVKHPISYYNQTQEEFLNKAPQDERRFHELIFSVGNATYRYHQRSTQFSPSLQDYREWLAGLEPAVRSGMEALGFEKCKSVLSFTRYVMENNDVGMEEYLKTELGEDVYSEYQSLLTKEGNSIQKI